MRVSKGGNFVNSKNAKEGELVTFMSEGEIQTSDRFKYQDGNPVKSLVFDVKYKGEDKQIKVTTQSKVALIEAFGDETRNWIGKSASIFIFPTQDGTNKTIFLKPIVENAVPHSPTGARVAADAEWQP